MTPQRRQADGFAADDLITDDGDVRLFMPFDDFRPPERRTYAEYHRRSIDFIVARNHRIKQLNR